MELNSLYILNINMENLFAENSIRTNSGNYFNYLDLENNTIKIEDIAASLSKIPRWLGHTNTFYSVAQHCCWCHDNINNPELKLDALLHDATEAYLSDIPSPLKKLLPDYQKIENRLHKVIAEFYGTHYPLHPEIKKVDLRALEVEWDNIKISNNPHVDYWSPETAEQEFLIRFNNIKNTKCTKNLAQNS